MFLTTGYPAPSNLKVEGLGLSESMAVSVSGAVFSKTLLVPPGAHVLRFKTDARRVVAPHDARTMVFRVDRFAQGVLSGIAANVAQAN
jgi:hypothetical protein